MGLLDKLFNREPKPGDPVSVSDATFEQEVLASDLPVVLEFYSTTCPACQVMTGLLKEVAPDFADRVKLCTAHVNQAPQVAGKFNVRGVPTTVFMKRGKVLDAVVGAIPITELRGKFEKLAKA